MNKPIPRWIHYFALVTTVLTWLLIIIGGVVHGTGSSLACPDWPTCYGSYFPEMTGGIFFEHSHRLVAAAVGLMTVVLWIALLARGTSSLKKWASLAVFLVVFQGVLGGITVLYRLPVGVSISHLATSMLFFALMAYLSFRTAHCGETHPRPIPPEWRAFSRWLGFVTLVVYLQIVLGALVRHTGSGLACLDIPFCQGSLWPRTEAWLPKIHMLHRWMGVLVAGCIAWLVMRVARTPSLGSFANKLLSVALVLVGIQIFLGFWSVLSGLGLLPVSLHLGIGALLWILFVYLNFFLRYTAAETSERIPAMHGTALGIKP